MTRLLPAVLVALALLTGCTGVVTPEPTAAPPAPVYPLDGQRTPAEVVRVVDGDTLVVLVDGEQDRVRILGVDAPEMRPRECGAVSATDHLTGLAPPTSSVTLVADTGEDRRDFFGRRLAYVRADGQDASHELVSAGWARVFEDYPTSATPQLRDAQQRAKTDRRGIWAPGTCPP